MQINLPSSDATALISAGFEFKFLVATVPLKVPDSASHEDLSNTTTTNTTTDIAPANDDVRDEVSTKEAVHGHHITPIKGYNLLFVPHSTPSDNAANSAFKFFPTPFNPEEAAQDEGLQSKVYRIIAAKVSSMPNQAAQSLQDLNSQGTSDADFWRTGWIVKRANSAFVIPDEQPAIEALHPRVCFVPVEMCSPILSWADKNSSAWEGVAKTIQKLKHTYSLATNPRCDVHVHLGRLDGRAFCLPTMKRLAVLFWLAEDVLRSVRDPRSNDFEDYDKAGATITNMSRLARGLPIPEEALAADDPVISTGPTAPGAPTHEPNHAVILGLAEKRADAKTVHALREILSCPSHLRLGLLLSGADKMYRRLGMNFSAFGREDERARMGPRTIEVRIMEDTLDEALITAWLHMCCALVEVAVDDASGVSRFEKTVEFLLLLSKISMAASQKMNKLSRYLGLSEENTLSLVDKVRMVE